LDDKLDKMTSPYAIRNLTEKTIKVYKIDKKGNNLSEEPEVIRSEQVRKLTVFLNEAKA